MNDIFSWIIISHSLQFKANQSHDDQVEMLLDEILVQDDNTFEHFCDALIQNGQAHVVDQYLHTTVHSSSGN